VSLEKKKIRHVLFVRLGGKREEKESINGRKDDPAAIVVGLFGRGEKGGRNELSAAGKKEENGPQATRSSKGKKGKEF